MTDECTRPERVQCFPLSALRMTISKEPEIPKEIRTLLTKGIASQPGAGEKQGSENGDPLSTPVFSLLWHQRGNAPSICDETRSLMNG